MRVLIVTLMLLVISLAGCAGGEPADSTKGDATGAGNGDGGNQTADPTTNGTTGGSSGSNGSNGNGAGGQNVTNAAPVLNLTANPVAGEPPLVVQFNLTVQDDGDVLTWTFFVDDNETRSGVGAVASFNHTFEEGTWNATVVVSDGEFTVNQTLQIVAVKGIPLGTEIFYIHATGGGNGHMDHTPAGGAEEGHGTVTLAGVPPFKRSYVATEPTTNLHPAGTSVEAHIQAFGLAPSPQTTMKGTLLVDGRVVGEATAAAQNVVTLALVTTPCTDWQIDFDITEEIPVGAIIEFRAEANNVVRLASCYPGGAAGPRVILSV